MNTDSQGNAIKQKIGELVSGQTRIPEKRTIDASILMAIPQFKRAKFIYTLTFFK